MGGWNTTHYSPFGMTYFQGRTVSFREGTYVHVFSSGPPKMGILHFGGISMIFLNGLEHSTFYDVYIMKHEKCTKGIELQKMTSIDGL